jgi:hypothetical protein
VAAAAAAQRAALEAQLREQDTLADALSGSLECAICSVRGATGRWRRPPAPPLTARHQELFIRAVTLPCAHSFCEACLLEWAAGKARERAPATCPNCRVPFKVRLIGALAGDQLTRPAGTNCPRFRCRRSGPSRWTRPSTR